jgi:hypothetical protein
VIRRGAVLALALALSGCGAAPLIVGAAIGAGATVAVAATNANVTILGWYVCDRGVQAACQAPAQPVKTAP